MKKYTMWIILGAILLVEIIIYLVAVSPQGAVIEEKAQKLDRTLKKLNRFARMGTSIPTDKANEILSENRGKLQKEYEKIVAFYRDIDKKGLKKWYAALNLTWDQEPTPAQFQSLYLDEFKKLEELCENNWITLGAKEDKNVIELASGEKLTGIIIREENDSIVLQDENDENPLPKSNIKRIGKIKSKLNSEESALVAGYRRFAKQLGPNDTVPGQNENGFWQTNELNTQNIRTAQMQFNIQKAIVNALIASGGNNLSFVSFFNTNPANGNNSETINEHFDIIPVCFIVQVPYGSVSTMIEKLNNSDPYINMKFVSLKIIKPKLATISTNYLPLARGITYVGQNTNFVFPKVLDKNGGVNFGQQPINKMGNLPDQDHLISEPPVVVEFAYNVMSMKKAQPEAQK